MNDREPSPGFLEAFASAAAGHGALPFDRFMELALYHPTLGYYRKDRKRVGYGRGTDFYTSSSSGAVFGELVCAACLHLLGDREAGKHVFVEIGAESREGVLAGVSHPFAGVRTVRVGESLDLAGSCVVFSNELFDAQPFRRFQFDSQGWHELGVELRGGALAEIPLPPAATRALPSALPSYAPAGYVIDAPIAAVELAGSIARHPWKGLFVAFDYGKTWRELIEATPAGTARAYHRHTQSNDLLARPGDQDLTCHVCWDWLADTLRENGFGKVDLDNQESFFIRHSESYLAPALAADAARFTPRKQAIIQLLHGAHLGQKFQVLHALR